MFFPCFRINRVFPWPRLAGFIVALLYQKMKPILSSGVPQKLNQAIKKSLYVFRFMKNKKNDIYGFYIILFAQFGLSFVEGSIEDNTSLGGIFSIVFREMLPNVHPKQFLFS